MLDRVFEYMKKYHMLETGERVVVAVSGGADSLALLHILKKFGATLPIELVVAHVHHGLRGKAADEDAKFVEDIAREWGIPFYLRKAKVRQLASDWRISEEDAGRRVRYEFFHQVLNDTNGQKIAMAHHRDDQAETILYHLIRGTGLAGLQGMKPVRDGQIIRPLLMISRKEIEDYCHAEGLQYRIDATNQEIIYTRNRIRHEVIPYIQKYFNPGFSESLARMGDIIREEEQFLSDYCSQVFETMARWVDGKIYISLPSFNSSPIAIKRRIFRWAVEKLGQGLTGLSYTHVDQVIDMALFSTVGSTLDLPRGFKARKDYGDLIIYKDEERPLTPPFRYSITIPGRIFIEELGVNVSCRRVKNIDVLNKGSWCIYIDSDMIQGPLSIRNRREGDRFRPLGMGGNKKLKDYFIDKKIPRNQRDAIPLIVDSKNIIWVAGCQLHEEYKITHNTQNILEIRISFTEFGVEQD